MRSGCIYEGRKANWSFDDCVMACFDPKWLRRRMVAVDAVNIEVLSCNNASMRYIFKRREI